MDLKVMQPKVQIMPVCEALSGNTYIYLCCIKNIFSNVAGDRNSFSLTVSLKAGKTMFEIMSLPPVEEVAGKAHNEKRNEKKSERVRRFGRGGGSKREWWEQNMKQGEARKQRFVSSEGAVRMLVVGVKDVERDVDQRNVERELVKGYVERDIAQKNIERDVAQENIESNIAKENVERDVDQGDVKRDVAQGNDALKDIHSKTTKNLDDQPFELKIEELDTIERLHVKTNPSGSQGTAHSHTPAGQQMQHIKKEDESMDGYFEHERGGEEFAPPDQRLMGCLFCVLLSLAILALLLSSLFVVPWGSWFQSEEEKTCPCSCLSD